MGGGQSSSSVSPTEAGCLQFEGTISTVGGGFCSCRTSEVPFGFAEDARGLRVTYVCDDKQYKISLSAASMHDPSLPVSTRDLTWSCKLPDGAGKHSEEELLFA